jgi:hypothetical protein
MRHDVERRRLLGQGFEQHPRVLLGRAADAEMIEGEYPVGVRALHAIEEVRCGQAAKRHRRMRKRAVEEQEGTRR